MDKLYDIRACRWYRIQGRTLFVLRSIVDFTKKNIALEGIRQEDYGAYEAHGQLVEYQGTYLSRATVEGIPFPAIFGMTIPFGTQIEEVAGIVEGTATVVEDRKALPAPGGK